MIVAYKWDCLHEIAKYRSGVSLIVYLDEKCFDTHDANRMIWFENTVKCILSVPPPKGKRVCYIPCRKHCGFHPKSSTVLWETVLRIICYGDMNGSLLVNWFENILLRNLSRDKKKCFRIDG